jgi:hypothetical protein
MKRCANCDRRIRGPDGAKLCLGDHDKALEEPPMHLHVCCPCPIHGWDVEFDHLTDP